MPAVRFLADALIEPRGLAQSRRGEADSPGNKPTSPTIAKLESRQLEIGRAVVRHNLGTGDFRRFARGEATARGGEDAGYVGSSSPVACSA